MLTTDKTNQPIIHHLMVITKKYLSTFADFTHHIPLERYHYALLYIYDHKESLTQKDLAEYFHVDKSFMVTMIDYLSNNGFVYRETSMEDRRKHLIKLTEKAHQYIPMINQAIEKTNNLALNGISDANKALFFEVIQQLEINLNIDNVHQITVNYIKSKI
ncbi:MarR family winged helix-turn-helix transcriptional regulator [Pedobacter arcticus]|uniref:MarR family winged helix-turn-helix transcriptional regulator n=1 Tax=Pedobacter arcticus TaxID=752140 RepID=UPI00036B0C91|nr:MarR family transcriptional regulator [Pedobacter arcticus]